MNILTNWNPELFTLINGFAAVFLMMLMLRIGGSSGIQAYVYLALIVANIQVLKGTNFFFIDEPVPLGTLVYGTISIALSIITEFYGKDLAKKTIWMGMIFMLGFTSMMLITIDYRPLNPTSISPEMNFLYENHSLMKSLFTPMPAILVSGLLAYLISERALVYLQISFQHFIRSVVARTYLTNSIAALLDLFIMNFLCWIVFNPNPITIKQLFISYIISSYPFRLLTASIAIPVIKLAKRIKN